MWWENGVQRVGTSQLTSSRRGLQTALLTGGGRSSAVKRRCFCWHRLLSVGNGYRQNETIATIPRRKKSGG
jgi:hypothetical protein